MTQAYGCNFILKIFVCSQLIQTVSAVDKDEPLRGHTFFFEMVPEFSVNPNFTVLDNKGK